MAESTFNLKLCHLVALAFVPPADVIAAYEELKGSALFRNHKDVPDPLLDYFVDTWIGGFNRLGRRKPPLFAVAGWNCYDAVLQGLPKTNKFCEGFHRTFASLLGVRRPTLPKLVQGLLGDLSKTTFRRELFEVSRFNPPNQSAQRRLVALQSAVGKYGNVPILSYLRGLALLLKFK